MHSVNTLKLQVRSQEEGEFNDLFTATDISETLKKKNQKKIFKQKSYVQLKLAGFC